MAAPARTRRAADRRQVRDELELDVVLGRLRPRERLVEDDLMHRFDAKRHVIRSALADLEASGLIERRPNRGATVREYGAAEVEELYDLRADLHRLAIARMPLPLGGEVIERLLAVQAAHLAAVDRLDLAEVIRHNDLFHDLMFDQCGNRFLAENIRRLGWAAKAIRSYRVGDPERLRQAAREHAQMIEAAAAGDRAGLSELVVAHILPSKEMYLRDRAGAPERRA